jgi:hypothetical protein
MDKLERINELAREYQDQGQTEAVTIGDFLDSILQSLNGNEEEKESMDILENSLEELQKWTEAAIIEIQKIKESHS